MKVAVIGAGAAGICAAHRLSSLTSGVEFIIYEQTGDIGGTWVYTEHTTRDAYGLPVHSSMYKNLRTNLPKETMEFPEFPFQNEKSFIHRSEVLKYLEDFTEHFELKKFIKFYHHVVKVAPNNSQWDVTVKNLEDNKIEESLFDAIFVCNGHFSEPRYPDLPGRDIFKRPQMHSHQYRSPETFKDQNILIIGSGPSGTDITIDIAPSVKKVYFSHHSEVLLKTAFPENVIHKPDVSSLTDKNVEFNDGTIEEVDAILYCTGYNYSFPFLTDHCGITVEDNFVQPLYKHLVNINHPTMCFIGIPWQALIFPLFDLQVCAFINMLVGNVQLPSKVDMFEDLLADVRKRKENGLKPRYYHRMGMFLRDYMTSLALTFKVDPVPVVVHKIFEKTAMRRREFLNYYREDNYEVVDSSDYVFHENKDL